MAKYQIDAMLDAALNYIKNNTTQEAVCRAIPTTYAEATSTYKLALKTGLSSASFTGPSDGDSSGRKLRVNEQANVDVDASNDATHVALCSADTLLYVTTCTQQTLTSGNKVTIPVWDIEIADVTA